MVDVLEKLSPSAINRFMQCPFSFYCHYVDRRQQINTPDTTSFGSTIHDILDHYYDIIDPDITIDEVPEYIEKAYTELDNYSTQKRKTATRKTQESFKRFEIKRIKKGYGMPTLREKMMSAKLSDDLPLIYGKFDVYFEKVGLIVDWKTGKWGELDDKLRIQGKMYKLILEANGYHPKKIIFNYLVLGKRIPLPEVSTEWLRTEIGDTVTNIKNGKFTKNHSILCTKWCGYRLDCDLDNMCSWVIPW